MAKSKYVNPWCNVLGDTEFINGLFDFHGGQDDPVYAVASSLNAENEKALTKSIVRDAIHNLSIDLDTYKRKHYKDISRADVATLKWLISTLNEIYEEMPDSGSDW